MNKDEQLAELSSIIYTGQSISICAVDVAKVIYDSGYRKTSEVAREIFDGIEEGIKAAISALQFDNNPIHRQVKHETYSRMMCFIKHLCEKYTEGGK